MEQNADGPLTADQVRDRLRIADEFITAIIFDRGNRVVAPNGTVFDRGALIANYADWLGRMPQGDFAVVGPMMKLMQGAISAYIDTIGETVAQKRIEHSPLAIRPRGGN